MMECLNDKTEQQRASHAWGPVGDMTPRTHRHIRSHTAWFCKPGDPREAELSSFQHYVANCQRCLLLLHNDDQAQHCTKPPPFFFYQQPRLPNDKRLFMILLLSRYTYCLTYVVPYISLTPPWTQHIHLMQWINDQWAGLSSGTSWHLAWCWKNTYPHFTPIRFLFWHWGKRGGQTAWSQGKLPIVHRRETRRNMKSVGT